MANARREALILGAVGIAAAAAGTVAGVLALQARSGAADLLAAQFHDLDGRPRRIIEWRGRVLVCNFWATWCAPCREEVPILVAAKQQSSPVRIEFVGIGIDSADKIREFAATYSINYPLLVADATAIDLLRGLGNRSGGLPFTALFDRNGRLAYRRLGALTATELRQVLAGLLG
jgi:thiol-disulfide isomerase/thioredoxin